MTNPTAQKFGYPESLVADAGGWLVLLRPLQPTFGSLVLVCKEPAQAFSELSADAFAGLQVVVRGVEQVLEALVGYERINYLMLMMVDRDVHFHVIPRYPDARDYEGLTFSDAGWPGPPVLSSAVELPPAALRALSAKLAALWPQP
jgi:diadenosine tetraphosphate (Ap4A) HIT family hydrolase